MGGLSNDKGRDATAIGDAECTIFVMPLEEIKKIRYYFPEIFEEMIEFASKRYKNHKILISKEVKNYAHNAKIDSSDETDHESYIADSELLNESMDSEIRE